MTSSVHHYLFSYDMLDVTCMPLQQRGLDRSIGKNRRSWFQMCLHEWNVCLKSYHNLVSHYTKSIKLKWICMLLILLLFLCSGQPAKMHWMFSLNWDLSKKKNHECLPHYSLVTSYGTTDLGQHWIRKWLVTCSVPSFCLSQCLLSINCTLRKLKHLKIRQQNVSHFDQAALCSLTH